MTKDQTGFFKTLLTVLVMVTSGWLLSCSDTEFGANSDKNGKSGKDGGKGGNNSLDDDTDADNKKGDGQGDSGGSEGGNDDDGEDDDGDDDDKTAEEKELKKSLKALPKFAMLANDFECGFCHVQIKGDIVSTKSVAAARGDSAGTVFGDWLVDGSFELNKKGAKINVNGQTKENYSGKEIPKNGFPRIDFSNAKSSAKGTLKGVDDSGSTVEIKKRKSGNVVIMGTEDSPLKIEGDVFIEGDLIIKGQFTGVGTIYVSGNIFVPFDLYAKKSPFPYADDTSDAAKEGVSAATNKKYDGLAFATPKSVFIGDVESGIIGAGAPINSRPEIQALESWYPKADYRKLYGSATHCSTGKATQARALNVVDAFIYAGRSIEGFSASSGFNIRGGIITDYFGVLNASTACLNSKITNPVHGRQMSAAYIEYDWRLASGKYQILERLGDALK